MKSRISLLILLLFTLAFAVVARKAQSQATRKAVSVPREIALPVIAYQPDCPLKLLYVDIQAFIDGGGREVLRYRNEGTRPIKGYTIAHLTPSGTGGTLTVRDSQPDEWIMPGKELVLGDTSSSQLTSITNELRKQLNLEGPMRYVFVFTVIQVQFADGSIYEDGKTYEALKAYFEKLSKCTIQVANRDEAGNT